MPWEHATSCHTIGPCNEPDGYLPESRRHKWGWLKVMPTVEVYLSVHYGLYWCKISRESEKAQAAREPERIQNKEDQAGKKDVVVDER